MNDLDAMIAAAMATCERINALCDRIEARLEVVK